jgi:signal transduction histidine kinase
MAHTDVAAVPPMHGDDALRERRLGRLSALASDEVLAATAIVAAALTVWVTLEADFLAHPVVLAIQKADFILGPVFVGLYWRRVRPASRFGPVLIAYGFVAVPYVLQSSSNSVLFPLGLIWELPIYAMTELLILTFPTGRLDGAAAKLILTVGILGQAVPVAVIALVLPQVGADFSLSACRALCPENGLSVTTDVPLALRMADAYRVVIVAVALATIVLLIWRFVTGTPPRRRALAIGTPLGLLFLASQFLHQGFMLLAPNADEPASLEWLIAGARSLLWYGFWFALIAAQLFAARALRGLVAESLGRPSFRELERLVRGPLGDPQLRLGFRRPRSRAWVDSDGAVLAPPDEGQSLTEVERDGRPAAAIVHDRQLSDDPELLQAAGAVALLALENAELDAAWKGSLRELGDSRARLADASDRERRKLERDLHDGAQQRLMAVQIKLRLAQERVEDEALAQQLDAVGDEAEQAVEELRNLAHGIYPTVLRDYGLAAALRAIAVRAPIPVDVTDERVGRCPRSIEAAVYFCSTEALQNAIKHAGDDAHVRITVGSNSDTVGFAVADDGVGMDVAAISDGGDGLIGMRDRIGAVGGELTLTSSPGAGTCVRGTIPLDGTRPGVDQPEHAA